MTKALGTKYNQGKPRMDLISPLVLLEIGKMLEFGARKYDENNWMKGISYQDLFAATQRHLNAWHQGIDEDSESGMSHLAHAITDLMMLLHFQLTDQAHLDNRSFKGINNGTD